MKKPRVWRGKWENNVSDTPTTCAEALKRLDFNLFPLIAVLIQIQGTVPVTTATVERSFSALRRLKTLEEPRLNCPALANLY